MLSQLSNRLLHNCLNRSSLVRSSVLSYASYHRSFQPMRLAPIQSPSLTSSVNSNGFQLTTRNSTSEASSAHNAHDHSKLWNIERMVSAGLLAVIPASFVVPCSALDYALALSLVAHVHWGLEAIAVDYVRPSLFGPVIPKIALGVVYLLSALSLAGLFYFNYTDVGLAQAIKMFLQK